MISRFAGASSRSMSELDLYLSIGQEAGLFQGTEEEKDSSLANREQFIRDEFLADLKKNGKQKYLLDSKNLSESKSFEILNIVGDYTELSSLTKA